MGPTNFHAMPHDLKLFIAGEWTEGTGEGHYEVNSPVTGEHIYNVPIASHADMDRAVSAAREATDEMRHWTAFDTMHTLNIAGMYRWVSNHRRGEW